MLEWHFTIRCGKFENMVIGRFGCKGLLYSKTSKQKEENINE